MNFSGEVGQFIDGKDAAVGAREQAVVDGKFIGKIAAAAGGTNGIDITDDVGHGDVRSGELFDEAVLTRHPGDRSVVAVGGDFFAAGAADGFQWVVVNFAAGDDGYLRIEQVDESAEDAALGLAAQAEQDKIMAREQGVDDLRDDRVFVSMDTGEERIALLDGAQQIAAELVLDGARSAARIKIGNALELTEGARFRMRRRLHGRACRH